MDELYIVMPAYNEAENIAEVIRQWYRVVEKLVSEGNDCHIVVADDGSKDETFVILKRLQSEYPRLLPLSKANSGHGATVMYLYRYALAAGASYVFQTDSDGQTIPDEFYSFWEHRHDYDFQIGSRNERKDGVFRVFVSKVLRLVVKVVFGVWVNDANTPFRLMESGRLRAVLQYVPEDFFLANVAVSAIAVKKEERIAWYPISFRPRQGGKNFINFRRIFKIGWTAIGDFRKINEKLQ